MTPTLAHDLILGNPTQPVGQRAGVASLEAVKEIIGGVYGSDSSESQVVSAQVSTWRATNLVIPSAGKWFVLSVDLPAHRGTYLVSGNPDGGGCLKILRVALQTRPNRFRLLAVFPTVEPAETHLIISYAQA